VRKLNDNFQQTPLDKLKDVMEFCEKQKGSSYKIPDAVFEVTLSSGDVQYFVLEAKTNVNTVFIPQSPPGPSSNFRYFMCCACSRILPYFSFKKQTFLYYNTL